jgi:hypothetical protein
MVSNAFRRRGSPSGVSRSSNRPDRRHHHRVSRLAPAQAIVVLDGQSVKRHRIAARSARNPSCPCSARVPHPAIRPITCQRGSGSPSALARQSRGLRTAQKPHWQFCPGDASQGSRFRARHLARFSPSSQEYSTAHDSRRQLLSLQMRQPSAGSLMKTSLDSLSRCAPEAAERWQRIGAQRARRRDGVAGVDKPLHGLSGQPGGPGRARPTVQAFVERWPLRRWGARWLALYPEARASPSSAS